ncbi:ORF6N domain-containing protein [Phocaeicola vulgatus]|uniref:ORF6N domain-containing protein n=3 Tax=Bacteroidia TaxID=200643 RepID=UPI003AB20BB9
MDLQIIQNKIFEVRGCRVMLDYHLAELYQVETRALKQAVKRNIERFPGDFMFVLTQEEANLLLSIGVSQNVIPPDYNFGVAMPMAFTEQGVAMLSSVLRSKVAIEVNISIMRAFVLMRQMAIGYEELSRRIEELEVSTDAQFNELYQALTQLLSQSKQQKERRPVEKPLNFDPFGHARFAHLFVLYD